MVFLKLTFLCRPTFSLSLSLVKIRQSALPVFISHLDSSPPFLEIGRNSDTVVSPNSVNSGSVDVTKSQLPSDPLVPPYQEDGTMVGNYFKVMGKQIMCF